MSQMSPEFRRLVEHLSRCAFEHKMALYSEMSQMFYMDFQRGAGRNLLNSALRYCRDRSGLIFTCERNVGYIPLRREERVEQAAQVLDRRIYSATQAANSILKTVDPEQLPEESLKGYVATQYKTMVHQTTASPEVSKKIEAVASEHVEKGYVRFTGLEYAKEALKALIDIS